MKRTETLQVGVDIAPGFHTHHPKTGQKLSSPISVVNGDTVQFTTEDGEFFKHGDMVTGQNGEQAIYLAKGKGAYHHVIFMDGLAGTIPDTQIRPLTQPLP